MDIIALFIVLAILFFSTRNWRRSINFVFILIVFEGALRKWVIPQASDLLYFLKDIILLGAYWKYFFASGGEAKYRITNSWLNLLIVFAFGIGLLQTFNPSLGSPILGLIGLKAYFIYVPLIWILPTMFRTEQDLINFLRWNLSLTIIVGIVGTIQYFSSPSSWINRYAPGDNNEVITLASGAIRIAGTFSFINSFQGYLIGVFALALPLAFIPQSPFWQVITLTELGFIVGNSMMTGSRTPVYTEALVTIGFFISVFITQPTKVVKMINNLIVPVVLATPIMIKAFNKAIETFSDRARSTRDTSNRINTTINEPLAYSQLQEGSGYGIGATHPGTRAIRNAFGISAGDKITVPNEAEPGKVMLEMGPFGFLIWYGLRISILLTLALRYFQLQKPLLKNLTLTAFLTQLVQLPGQVVFHHTFGLYYWLFTSFIFVFPQIELWEHYLQQQMFYIGNQAVSMANYQQEINPNS